MRNKVTRFVFSLLFSLLLSVACSVTVLSSKEGSAYASSADTNISVRDISPYDVEQNASVLYVSGEGSDSNSGNSAISPLKSIQVAINNIAENGTIYVLSTLTLNTTNTFNNTRDNINIVKSTGGKLFDIT